MASQSGNPFGAANPFGIPGLNLPGDDGNIANPVLQSMEMMRQVWGSLGALSGTAPISPAMGIDELDRRITDLRAVENWLNLNLTMLRGTIQGLEVQRATISTLRSFAQTASEAYGAAGSHEAPPSPLEVALGLRRPPADARPAASSQRDHETAPPPEPEAAAQGEAASAAAKPADAPAANLWWNLLQDQFQRMASAAAASMPGPAAGAVPAASAKTAKPAAKSTARPASAPRASKTARKSAAPGRPRKPKAPSP